MAIKYEDECVNCPTCMGFGCPNRDVRRLYCDCCRMESERLFRMDDIDYCEDCFAEKVGVDVEELDECIPELRKTYDFYIVEDDDE